MNHELPYVQHIQKELWSLTVEKKHKILRLASFRDYLVTHPPENNSISELFCINPEFKIFTCDSNPFPLVTTATDKYFSSLLTKMKKKTSFVSHDQPLDSFEKVVQGDFKNITNYLLHWGRQRASGAHHEYSFNLEEAQSYATLCGEDISNQIQDIRLLYNTSCINKDKEYIADVIKQIEAYKPGDDIVGLCCSFGWAVLSAQERGFDIDFAEELGPCLFPHIAQYVREYILNPQPKPIDDRQYEAIVANHLRTAFEVIQYCTNNDHIMQAFKELVVLAKSKQSEYGQGFINWYLDRLGYVLSERERGRSVT